MTIFKIKYLLTILISCISINLMFNKNSTDFYDKTNLNTKNDLVTNNHISIGGAHIGFIDWKGDLYTWGDNDYGQLGHGNTIDLEKPKKVLGLNNVKEISLGSSSSAAITESGDVYTWGKNGSGQLGHGDKTDLNQPKKVPGLNNVKKISFGSFNLLAMTESGDLYSWGSNLFGQLGLGKNNSPSQPTKISGLNNVKEISAGFVHSSAITESGDLYSWGTNINGLVGPDHEIGSILYEPKKLSGLNNVKKVSNSSFSSGVITNSGDLYTWGDNEYGQLGHGDEIDINAPKKVAGLNNVKEVFLGMSHSSAITKSGHLYTWGDNDNGQLGHGDEIDINVPKKVAGLNDVKEVSLGNMIEYSSAITESGDLYSWGLNSNKPFIIPGLSKQPTIKWMDDVIHPIWYSNNSGQIGFKYMIQLFVGDIIDPKGTYTLFKNDIEIRSEEFDLEFNVERKIFINDLEEGNYSLKVEFFKDVFSYFECEIQEVITLTKESIENPSSEVIVSEIYEDGKTIIFNQNSLSVEVENKLGSLDSFEFIATNNFGAIISSSSAIIKFKTNENIIFVLANNWSFNRDEDFHIKLRGQWENNFFETQNVYEYTFLYSGFLNFNIAIIMGLIFMIIISNNGFLFYYIIRWNKRTKLLINEIDKNGYFLSDDYDEEFELSL